MKIAEQPPMSEDVKKYLGNEDRLAALRAKPTEDLSIEEFKELKDIKQNNTELADKAEDEGRLEQKGRIMDEAKTEDAEGTGASIKERAEKIMRSMANLQGEWGHLPEDAPEVMKKLKELMLKPGAKLGKNENWNEIFKNLEEIDFEQVNEILDHYNGEISRMEEDDKKMEIRREAEEVMRSMADLQGEWEHLPEDAPEVMKKLKSLLLQEGVMLDPAKKWDSNFRDLDEIDFDQVRAIVDSFKHEVADEKSAAELTERIKSGKIGDTTESDNGVASDSIEGGGAENVVVERTEKENRAKHLLGELFRKGETFNPFMGQISKEIAGMGEELEEKLEGLNQKRLAEEFFKDTIGQNILNIPRAYSVYGLLKGTEFSKTFKELESDRLKKAGYSEFTL